MNIDLVRDYFFVTEFNFRYYSTDLLIGLILVFGDKLVLCRRSLIKLELFDEIILSKGKPLLVRIIYSDIYLPFDIASFVTRIC